MFRDGGGGEKNREEKKNDGISVKEGIKGTWVRGGEEKYIKKKALSLTHHENKGRLLFVVGQDTPYGCSHKGQKGTDGVESTDGRTVQSQRMEIHGNERNDTGHTRIVDKVRDGQQESRNFFLFLLLRFNMVVVAGFLLGRVVGIANQIFRFFVVLGLFQNGFFFLFILLLLLLVIVVVAIILVQAKQDTDRRNGSR